MLREAPAGRLSRDRSHSLDGLFELSGTPRKVSAIDFSPRSFTTR